MARIECDGDHGKQGMNGCLDPKFTDGAGKPWCVAKLAQYLVKAELAQFDQTSRMIDNEVAEWAALLDAYFDAAELFGDYKRDPGKPDRPNFRVAE